METKESLLNKLKILEQQENVDAKYPTGLIIDISGPEGNIYYLFGVANRLVRELKLSPDEKAEFERERNEQRTYQEHLDVMVKWFGIIFVGENLEYSYQREGK
jgi:hypothetical protein